MHHKTWLPSKNILEEILIDTLSYLDPNLTREALETRKIE